jgi:hypothetical protein
VRRAASLLTAALIYLHATRERQQVIADAVSKNAQAKFRNAMSRFEWS